MMFSGACIRLMPNVLVTDLTQPCAKLFAVKQVKQDGLDSDPQDLQLECVDAPETAVGCNEDFEHLAGAENQLVPYLEASDQEASAMALDQVSPQG